MKKLLALSLVVSTLAACGPANQDYTKKLKDIEQQTQKDIEDIRKKGLEDLEGAEDAVNAAVKAAMAAMEAEGANAGRLTIEGVLVARQGNKFVLDTRIQALQEGGKRSDGSSALNINTKAQFSELASGKKDEAVIANNKFINLGCENLSAAETENLEELEASLQSSEKMHIVSAKKIFICGAQKIENNYITITANELFLQDADISLMSTEKVSDDQGSLNIAVNTLVLQGQNKVSTLGQSSSVPVPNGASLQMTVREELRGSGNLTLKTLGGDVIKATENSDSAADE